MSQETKIARAALREIGLGPVADLVSSRRNKETGTFYPTLAGSGYDITTIPFKYVHLVRKAFLLAHQYHDEGAFMDKHGTIHCEACVPSARS